MGKKFKTAKPPLGWQMTPVVQVLDYLNDRNNLGKEPETGCLIEYKGETWRLEKVKSNT